MRTDAPIAGDADRAPQVREMFDTLAPSYDRANRVISMGLDQGWRRKAIRDLGPAARGEMVDLCAGTLDLTVMLIDAGATSVKAIDFAHQMLLAGKPKIPDGADVTLVTADAREVPLPDASVDGVIAGFGLRNVPEVERAVEEAARILRPGGRFVVLEFFQPTSAFSRFLQGSYNRLAMPLLGGLVSGYGSAYRYLAGSIDAFMTRADFEQLLRDQGFDEVTGEDMFPPVASLVCGTRGPS
ncbi:MAG: ubiquinone/menaquinone biosynthesis methyltransferase [Myxococcota bacterium]|nr:ubiquinone/menaquinone biosynthesis methyltransferase [Myxococcota bacterium]MEC8424596.1 ubiquinone/menaquinone biosynthesis methyltransferase [Myxococcota bacterium]